MNKKLIYNVYQYISDDRFLDVRKSLELLEDKMIAILNPLDWYITEPVSRNDYLIINFVSRAEEFYGNLGIAYNDNVGKESFRFYILKSIDLEDNRYFIRQNVIEDRSLEDFYINIYMYLKDGLIIYDYWKKENILGIGEYVRIND